ncbi:MAG: hypothetical protein QNJ97_13115 [Myxococcota bacterium]|nr:hypothetical protein [Myxococcota bacterium]
MQEEHARETLQTRAQAGHPLRTVANGDLRVIKRLLDECLQAGIPVMLGPCTVSG